MRVLIFVNFHLLVVTSCSPYGYNFNTMEFVQEWPIVECLENPLCHDVSRGNQWTIKGIKAYSQEYGDDLCYCDPVKPFELSKIKPLVNELSWQWTSDHVNPPTNNSLWRLEWEKHGSCLSESQTLNTEYKYFRQGTL